jgi:hypothetical protein
VSQHFIPDSRSAAKLRIEIQIKIDGKCKTASDIPDSGQSGKDHTAGREKQILPKGMG